MIVHLIPSRNSCRTELKLACSEVSFQRWLPGLELLGEGKVERFNSSRDFEQTSTSGLLTSTGITFYRIQDFKFMINLSFTQFATLYSCGF